MTTIKALSEINFDITLKIDKVAVTLLLAATTN